MKDLLTYSSMLRLAIRSAYNQVFFSDNKWFARALFLASFTDVYVGISGLSAVLMALLLGHGMGFRKELLHNGLYTCNVLLVGLTMGAYFRLNVVFFVILLLASLLTLLLSVWLQASFARKRLPMLSLPFVLAIWLILLSARHFNALGLSERGIYTFNELWDYGGIGLVNFYLKTGDLGMPSLLVSYFRAMGAVFFQNHVLAGMLITAGLLIFSRIAFSLSVIGFFSGYVFCTVVQGNLTDLEYSYIGFNYILTAMAIGGFFLVPSTGSYILAAVSAPLISLFVSALSVITGSYLLPLYSLPFTLVVLLILHALNNRYRISYLYLVEYQLFSPEKNLYLYRHYTGRFRGRSLVFMQLPFYGEWTVSQGHHGELTHREDWRFALDFVVTDEEKRTYRLPGREPADFYCYELPVLAPADGEVIAVEGGIADNAIGDVNLKENWGNTIVIRHSDGLYSKLSHLRKESIRVKPGERVRQGDRLALCGSSGRSPEPHLHFQLQALPYIGAATIDYPLGCYVSRKDKEYELHTYATPAEGETIQRPLPTPLLSEAFHFIPGMKLEFSVSSEEKKETVVWDVMTDAANFSYFSCRKTGSVAYFVNDGTLFHFTSFSGDHSALLYYFYLGAHKLLLSYFPDIRIKDELPLDGFYKGGLRFFQDMLAPFALFLRSSFEARYTDADSLQAPSELRIQSQAQAFAGSAVRRQVDVELGLSQQRLSRIIVRENGSCITAEHIAS